MRYSLVQEDPLSRLAPAPSRISVMMIEAKIISHQIIHTKCNVVLLYYSVVSRKKGISSIRRR